MRPWLGLDGPGLGLGLEGPGLGLGLEGPGLGLGLEGPGLKSIPPGDFLRQTTGGGWTKPVGKKIPPIPPSIRTLGLVNITVGRSLHIIDSFLFTLLKSTLSNINISDIIVKTE